MASLHEDLQRSDAMDTRPTATIRPIQYGINASRPLPDAPRRIVGLLMYSSSRRARQQTHSGPRLFGNATNFTILHARQPAVVFDGHAQPPDDLRA